VEEVTPLVGHLDGGTNTDYQTISSITYDTF
jgi:hypothetical protein